MRRLRTTCWFAQTVLERRWYETADRRSTALASARRSRKTSTAGETHFLSSVSSIQHVMVSFVVFSQGHAALTPPALLLYGRSIYIFRLFIAVTSQLNYFPCASPGLSTSRGTTGNATCSPSTASPTARRSRPTSTSLCTKKKVNPRHCPRESCSFS